MNLLIVDDEPTNLKLFRAQPEAEATLREQLAELRRWQALMLGREERNMTLKREANELCRRLGEPARYPSQAVEGDEGRATSDL